MLKKQAAEQRIILMNTSVILPTYNPTERLIKVIDGLTAEGFDDIIIVDDGSRVDTQPVFARLEAEACCTVLHHQVNMGKGRALKTGFRYFLDNRPSKAGVVTADDDGQHRPEDIAACVRLMEEADTAVYGVRDFKNANVPPKSRFGNKVTGIVFRCCCGIALSDTQTGLRALPRKCLEMLCGIKGERFEYETNMLLAMKEAGLDFIQQPISTVYENENKSTHFRPIKDSVKIYAIILKYLASSLLCSLLDVALFTVLNMCLDPMWGESGRVLASACLARLISSLLNYILNRGKIFHSRLSAGNTLAKYYAVIAVQMTVSYFIVMGLTALLGIHRTLWQTAIKTAADALLFFASFSLQGWVFKNDGKRLR